MSHANKPRLSTTQLITLGFLAAVQIGAVLLTMPVSSASGEAPPSWTSCSPRPP